MISSQEKLTFRTPHRGKKTELFSKIMDEMSSSDGHFEEKNIAEKGMKLAEI